MRLISARKLFLLVIGLYLLACSYVSQQTWEWTSDSVDIREDRALNELFGNPKGDGLVLHGGINIVGRGPLGDAEQDAGDGVHAEQNVGDWMHAVQRVGGGVPAEQEVGKVAHGEQVNVERKPGEIDTKKQVEENGKGKTLQVTEAKNKIDQETSRTNKTWEQIQMERKAILSSVCKTKPELNVNMTWIIHDHKRWLWPFIYNDDHKLIYCYVSKIASTNWKSAFLVLQGKYKRIEDIRGSRAHDPSIHKLSKLEPAEIEFRLKNYTKFLFVRDPLSRALSAYRSKFLQKNKSFQRSFGRRIIKTYRQNPDQHALQTGEGVTFPEFAKYLGHAPPAKMDGHWKPIHDMVLPCGVKFDYIGKLETGHVDSVNILKKAHVDHIIYFKESTRNVSHDQGVFDSFYNQLGPEHIKGLYKTYELDFKLFGYELPDKMKKWVFGNGN